MIRQYVTAGLVGTALLATAAFAQTPTTTDRAKEAELHRYYGMPPYWGGF